MSETANGRDTELAEAVGRRVRLFRRTVGWTAEQLAAALHEPPAHVRRIEGGRAQPTVQALARIARALGVALADLVPDSVPAIGGTITLEHLMTLSIDESTAARVVVQARQMAAWVRDPHEALVLMAVRPYTDPAPTSP